MSKMCLLSALSGVAIVLATLPAQAATVQVLIEKLVYSPVEIQATVGDTIEWVNKDIMVHTATVDGVFDVNIAARKSESMVVTKAGIFDYYCRFHPNMRARLVVRAK